MTMTKFMMRIHLLLRALLWQRWEGGSTTLLRTLVVCGFLLVVTGGLVGQQITYTYDQAGRLVGVVDPSGNGASYRYDAVGNIVSIQRYSSSQVGIFNFKPNSASVGSTVTLNGTGFSTTASQNTLKFNGISAAVSSSTSTQIVTSVPAGATTGPISVTSPLGSTTSSDQFVVIGTGGSASPLITTFSPAIVASGGTATINGSNFSSSPSSNDVKVNVGFAPVTSASASTLTVGIPSDGTSGRITVTTPTGSAVSSGDLFIEPPGQVVPSGSTGRMTIGSTASFNVPSYSTGLMIFDAAASQRVSIDLTGTGTCAWGAFDGAYATLFDPLGNILAYQGEFCTGGGLGADLLISGTYTIRVQSETASVTTGFTIHNVVAYPATINGGAVSVTFPASNQIAELIFTNSQLYQPVTITGTNNTVCEVWADNYGSTNECAATFSWPQDLTSTGVNTLVINPNGQAGSVTVSITSP
jgi:YD repeat-containing protein